MSETNENCNTVYNQEETEISIASIIALGFNHIKGVLIALCLGLVLLGGWKFYSAKKSVSSQPEISVEYQKQLELLENQVATYEKQAQMQAYYNENSPLMNLDPSNTVKTVATYGVSVEDNFALSDDGRISSASGLVAKEYISYIKSLNLSSLTNTKVPSEWLMETVFLTPLAENSAQFQLVIYTNSEQEGNELMSAIGPVIMDSQNTISNISYKHKLILFSIQQMTTNDVKFPFIDANDTITNNGATNATTVSLINKQLEANNKLNDIINKVDDAKKAVSDHLAKMPSTAISKREIVKWAAIGAVLGAFLYCLYLLISFISKAPVTSSGDIAEKTGLTYLGSFYRKRSWNTKIADSLLNERVFSSSDAASDFTVESIKSIIPAKQNVLLVSSFYKDETAPEAAAIIDTLKKAGCNPVFAGDALVSARFISELSKADSVILFEKKWHSQWRNIFSVLQVISRKEKKPAGFILA